MSTLLIHTSRITTSEDISKAFLVLSGSDRVVELGGVGISVFPDVERRFRLTTSAIEGSTSKPRATVVACRDETG